jgi:hypothetical protein
MLPLGVAGLPGYRAARGGKLPPWPVGASQLNVFALSLLFTAIWVSEMYEEDWS